MDAKNWKKLAMLTDSNRDIIMLVQAMCLESFQEGVDKMRGEMSKSTVIAEFECSNSAGSAVIRSFGGDYVVTTKIRSSEHHQGFSDINDAMEALNFFIEYCGESRH